MHVEVGETAALIAQMRDLGLRVGLAANPDTPFEALEPFLDQVDLVLCMTVFPGFGGQSFMAEVLPKIAQVQSGGRLPPAWPLDVEVDGGIDERTVVEVTRAGANVFVAGSAVFNRDDPLGCGRRDPGGRRGRAGRSGVLTHPVDTRTADDRLDAAGGRRRRAGPRSHLAQPVGRRGAGARRPPATSRRPGSPEPPRRPAAPTPKCRRWRRPGDRARGGTLYVTLEPCAHHGRTPPCVDAVLAAGVTRVVVGMADPDPLVDGRGIAALREAGVEVEVGVAADVVAEQLAPYVTHRRTGRPWVVLKLAATLDGRIAAPDGSSRWITGEEARLDAHRLRAVSDAVIVGAGTVRADDPAPDGAPARRRPAVPRPRRAAGPGGARRRARRRRRAAGARAARAPG